MDWKNNINLERAVLIKIAVLLWRHLLENCRNFGRPSRESKCIEHIETLPLPNELREKVKKIIIPIAIEIIKFDNKFKSTIVDKNHTLQVPVNRVWTVQGTVDTRRTCKLLITDESLDLAFRYKLACHCCLENDIAILWNQMSEEQKSDFLRPACHSYLEYIWSRQIGNKEALGEFAGDEGFSYTYEYVFLESVSVFNKDAVEFFWKKLRPEARRILLPKAMKEIRHRTSCCIRSDTDAYHICYCTEIVLFLFSRGDKEPLENLSQCSDYRVLRRLLDWPYHEYILEILDSMQLTIASTVYYGILRKLVFKIVFGFYDFNYGLLLKMFLKQRTKFQEQCDQPIFPSTYDIISHFRDDAEAISLIASYCKTILKKDVIIGENIFETLSDVEEWEFLTFVIDECILKSKQEIFQRLFKVQTSRRHNEHSEKFSLIYKIHLFLSDITQNKINVQQSN